MNIVEQIDHAIRDWGTSSDAMRWAPQLDADIDGAAAEYEAAPLGPVLIDPARVWRRTGRALWLRRHRNTGPTPRLRVPRRIDPGRSR